MRHRTPADTGGWDQKRGLVQGSSAASCLWALTVCVYIYIFIFIFIFIGVTLQVASRLKGEGLDCVLFNLPVSGATVVDGRCSWLGHAGQLHRLSV